MKPTHAEQIRKIRELRKEMYLMLGHLCLGEEVLVGLIKKPWMILEWPFVILLGVWTVILTWIGEALVLARRSRGLD